MSLQTSGVEHSEGEGEKILLDQTKHKQYARMLQKVAEHGGNE